FTLSYRSGTSTAQETYLRDATEDQTIDQRVRPDYWGSQIDVCGNYGNFDVHPAWHKITRAEDPVYFGYEQLQTNRGGCILVKPFLEKYPQTDPEAFPELLSGSSSVDRFLYTDMDNSNQKKWSPYGYFDFVDGNSSSHYLLNQPTQMSTEVDYFPSIQSGIGGLSFGHFKNTADPNFEFNGSKTLITKVGGPSSSPIPQGIYHANYRNQNSFTFGSLGFSDQRKLVMT